MMILGAEDEPSLAMTPQWLPTIPFITHQAFAVLTVVRGGEGTSHGFLGGPETTLLAFILLANKPPYFPSRWPVSLATSFLLLAALDGVVKSVCRLENIVHGHWWWYSEMRKPKPQAVVGDMNCGFGRVYFSIFYEENGLFSKTEIIFLTNVVTSK